MGSERGEQPLSRCGERGVQRERGGSRNTPLTLWPSGATPAAMHLAKGIRPAPRDHPLCGKPPSDAASLPRFPTLRIFFFCNFLRDFPLFFRWKAVVDSVQFRVILNITTKRFDVVSWHAEMLRFGRRPTAADAASRNDPSREKATLENPQIFQSCKFKNNSSAATTTTTACGRNRKELLGQRPAGHECRSRHEMDAGCRNSFCQSEAEAISNRPPNQRKEPDLP